MKPLDKYLEAAAKAGCHKDQIERFCRAGIVLSAKQLRASAMARLCDLPNGPRHIGYGGAMSGGKTFWVLVQACIDDCQRFPGLKVLLLRKVGSANKENFNDIRLKILRNINHNYVATQGYVFFDNGSSLRLGHFKDEKDVEKYLGLEYDVILVEEATTLTASKLTVIETRLRTSKEGWRPRMYWTSNPGGISHAHFKQKFIVPYLAGKETTTRFIPATVLDNGFVDDEYANALSENLIGWQRKAWLEGDWDVAAGMFFTNFRQDVHVFEPGDIEVMKHWRFWGALDYGFTHDTGFLFGCEDDDGNLYLLDEHAESGKLPEHHAECIKGLLVRNGLTLDDLQAIKAGHDVFSKTHGRSIADTYEEFGIILRKANIDRITGWGEMLRRFGEVNPVTREIVHQPTLFISRKCTKTIEQIPAMIHDDARPEDAKKVNSDEAGRGGDDLADTARYWVMHAYSPRPHFGSASIQTMNGSRVTLTVHDNEKPVNVPPHLIEEPKALPGLVYPGVIKKTFDPFRR